MHQEKPGAEGEPLGTMRSSAAVVSDDVLARSPAVPTRHHESVPLPLRRLRVMIVVPTIEIGAADEGAIDLAGILSNAGHQPIVVSQGGRLEARLARTSAEFVRLDAASRNPAVMTRNTAALFTLARGRRCDVVHALGRACAWSAYAAARLAGVPFATSWYKGFREQNAFKHAYNSVMARGDRIMAVSDQLAELIMARHRTPEARISVIPAAIDFDRFDPAALSPERIQAVREAWGVQGETRVVLVAGRMLRRKGHHVVVQAARRLKERGITDILFVFAGEDQGRSRYTGELWDLVLATGTADVIRMAPNLPDIPAAYGAADAVVSAAVQPEGLQRSILEGSAMARPLVVSDLAAGSDIVLAAPAVPEDRATGLRFPAGDDGALAAALVRLFGMPEASRRALGRRGREWVLAHCDPVTVASQVLAFYAALAQRRTQSHMEA
jgi:glycosyltransferase involved in cell wall biosynthesis